jgi:hypothetical protein
LWAVPPNHLHLHGPVPRTTRPFPEDLSFFKSSTTKWKCNTFHNARLFKIKSWQNDQSHNLSCLCSILQKDNHHPSHSLKSDWTPSATRRKGVTLEAMVVKFCSYVDSCWNCHSPS